MTGCAQVAIPTATSVPAPVASALPTVSVPNPILSSANVASMTRLEGLQTEPGAHASCALQSDVLAVGEAKTISVYKASTLEKAQSVRPDFPYALVAVSPDGQRIASANTGGELEIWDAANGKVVRYMKLEPVAGPVFQEFGTYVGDLAFGPGHGIVIGATRNIFYLAADTGQVNHIFTGAVSNSSNVAITADGHMIAIANVVKGAISLWQAPDGQLLKQLTSPGGDWLTGMAFGGGGATLAAGDQTRGIYSWDTQTGQLVSTLAQAGIQAFALSRDGTLVFSAQGSQLAVWDFKSGKLLRALATTSSPIQDLKICVDGRFLLAGSQSGDVALWGVKP